ncbi:UNVERIFIED_CONTAM: hypothetical protein NCL1_54581 [Trichonephila clavipes]
MSHSVAIRFQAFAELEKEIATFRVVYFNSKTVEIKLFLFRNNQTFETYRYLFYELDGRKEQMECIAP